ncbi:hypothetical protein [Lysobacter gummosus]|uniref:hypothetical protein n=1 Tax=Lysobacter gummosus TaxID=262324 RepID=UPI0036368DFF
MGAGSHQEATRLVATVIDHCRYRQRGSTRPIGAFKPEARTPVRVPSSQPRCRRVVDTRPRTRRNGVRRTTSLWRRSAPRPPPAPATPSPTAGIPSPRRPAKR